MHSTLECIKQPDKIDENRLQTSYRLSSEKKLKYARNMGVALINVY